MCASTRPPHLRALNPREGFTDHYREFAFHVGIPEIGLTTKLPTSRFDTPYDRNFGIAENFVVSMSKHPLDDEYWADERPRLDAIEVPALVCASWSDQGLHSRGTLLWLEKWCASAVIRGVLLRGHSPICGEIRSRGGPAVGRLEGVRG